MMIITAKFHVRKKKLSGRIARNILKSPRYILKLSMCIHQAFLRSLLISSASQRHDAEMQHPEPINMHHTHAHGQVSIQHTYEHDKRRMNIFKNYPKLQELLQLYTQTFNLNNPPSKVTKSLQLNYIIKSFVVRFNCIML